MFQLITLKNSKENKKLPRISCIQVVSNEDQAWEIVWPRISTFLVVNHLVPGVTVRFFEVLFRTVFFRDKSIALSPKDQEQGYDREVYYVVEVDGLKTVDFDLHAKLYDVRFLISKLEQTMKRDVPEFGDVEIDHMHLLAVRTRSIYYETGDCFDDVRKHIRKLEHRIRTKTEEAERLRREDAKAHAVLIDELEQDIEELRKEQMEELEESKELSDKFMSYYCTALSFAEESGETMKALKQIQGPERNICEELRLNNWFVSFTKDGSLDSSIPFSDIAKEIEEQELNRFNDALRSLKEKEEETENSANRFLESNA